MSKRLLVTNLYLLCVLVVKHLHFSLCFVGNLQSCHEFFRFTLYVFVYQTTWSDLFFHSCMNHHIPCLIHIRLLKIRFFGITVWVLFGGLNRFLSKKDSTFKLSFLTGSMPSPMFVLPTIKATGTQKLPANNRVKKF